MSFVGQCQAGVEGKGCNANSAQAERSCLNGGRVGVSLPGQMACACPGPTSVACSSAASVGTSGLAIEGGSWQEDGRAAAVNGGQEGVEQGQLCQQ